MKYLLLGLTVLPSCGSTPVSIADPTPLPIVQPAADEILPQWCWSLGVMPPGIAQAPTLFTQAGRDWGYSVVFSPDCTDRLFTFDAHDDGRLLGERGIARNHDDSLIEFVVLYGGILDRGQVFPGVRGDCLDSRVTLMHILRHELGHSLGYPDQDTDPTDLMYYRIPADAPNCWELETPHQQASEEYDNGKE